MSTLNFDVFYRDHGAQKGLQSLGREADAAARKHEQFRKIAIGAAVLGGAALVKFGKDSVRAFSESQSSQQALGFAFRKFPRLADTNQAALQRLNTELQKKTRADDDAIASGQAVLAQFNLTGKQITQVTPLLVDYAVKTGKDIPAAAKDVGKALLGNAKALKNIGISYKSTGNASQDFANITALMQQKVGGFATKEGATFSGRLAILKNQFGELQETAGSKLVPALTGVVEGLTKVVEFVGENSKVIGPLVGTVVGLSAAIWTVNKATKIYAVTQAVLGGISTKVVSGLSALKLGFTGVELSAIGAGRAMKIAQLSIPIVGVALFAVTTALELFASKSDTAAGTANGFAEAMKTVEGDVTRATAALNENVRAQAVQELQSKGAFEQAKLLGLSYGTVTDAALGNKAAINEVNAATTRAMALNPQLSKANADQRTAAIGLSGSLNGVALETIGAANAENVRRSAMVGTTTASGALETATKGLKTANANLKTELQQVINKFTILREGALGVEQANISWQDSIDGVAASVKANGHSLNIHTAAGRANRQSIIGMMTALNDKVKADFEATVKTKGFKVATEEASRSLKTGRQRILDSATAAGINKTAVAGMIGKMVLTPKELRTAINTKGMKAVLAQIADLKARIKALEGKSISVKVGMSVSQSSLAKSIVAKYGKFARIPQVAAGGPIQNVSGMGVKGKDTEPIIAAVGEHMWTAKETDAVGGHGSMYRLRKAALRGELQGFDRGGALTNHGALNFGRAGARGDAIARKINVNHSGTRSGIDPKVVVGRTAAYLGSAGEAYAAALAAAYVKAAGAVGPGGGPIGGGGYVRALNWVKHHNHHPYVYATIWDCSGLVGAAHSVALGQSPHRRYTTTAFHGSHAAGFTRGKSSPFMVGVRPLAGKLGHMAATINGVNVESAGGVGVRYGRSARGAHSAMFSWRGGLAGGGPVRRGTGDLPFDLLDPQGERYNPELANLLHKVGYANGTNNARRGLALVGERGPELVKMRGGERVIPLSRPSYARAGGSGGVGNVVYNVTINAPNYIGSRQELKQTLVGMARRGELEVIKR